MSFWFLVQLLVNLILTAGVVAMWIRLNRPQKDDPRLSKGLQLLQSKIAVLEDLSDRTEVQVNQLTALLEQKCKDIQTKIQASEKQLAKIDQSTQKSLEVAKIFQDRIPHTEILERQNTIKYVKAARLAHQGLSFDEIAQQVDLSRGEIEFIAKVNKDQLMFCEDSLPEWAQESADTGAGEAESLIEPGTLQMPAMNPFQLPRDMSAAFDVPQNDQQALKKLGEAFKAACAESVIEENKPGLNLVGTDSSATAPAASTQMMDQTRSTVATTSSQASHPATMQSQARAASTTQAKTPTAAPTAANKAKTPNIRPVEFRRIDMAKDLG